MTTTIADIFCQTRRCSWFNRRSISRWKGTRLQGTSRSWNNVPRFVELAGEEPYGIWRWTVKFCEIFGFRLVPTLQFLFYRWPRQTIWVMANISSFPPTQDQQSIFSSMLCVRSIHYTILLKWYTIFNASVRAPTTFFFWKVNERWHSQIVSFTRLLYIQFLMPDQCLNKVDI